MQSLITGLEAAEARPTDPSRGYVCAHETELVTVDPQQLRVRIHCAGLLGETDQARQAQVLSTNNAMWVARDEQLIRVDPGSAAWHQVSVTGERAQWAATPHGLVGTDWPAGRVSCVRDNEPITTRELGGHLAGIAAGGGQVWIVDRTEETLLGLDRLLGELRAGLTATTLIQDQRTGQTRPSGPAVHEHFRRLGSGGDDDEVYP